MIAWHRQYYITPLQFIGSALSRCIALVDVMVMGAVARSFIDRVFIGDTAAHLLETLPCDVLIVRQPPKAVTV